MILLKTTRQALIWLCVCPPPEGTNIWKRIFYVFFSFVVFFFIAFSGIWVFAFFLKAIHTDLEESLFAFFQVNATIGVIYMLTAGVVLRYKVKDMLEDLKALYEASKIFSNKSQMLTFYK